MSCDLPDPTTPAVRLVNGVGKARGQAGGRDGLGVGDGVADAGDRVGTDHVQTKGSEQGQVVVRSVYFVGPRLGSDGSGRVVGEGRRLVEGEVWELLFAVRDMGGVMGWVVTEGGLGE